MAWWTKSWPGRGCGCNFFFFCLVKYHRRAAWQERGFGEKDFAGPGEEFETLLAREELFWGSQAIVGSRELARQMRP
jgi:hypothetical protein